MFDNDNSLQLFWESSGGEYMRPTNNSRAGFFFSKQKYQRTFELESSLYGIFTIRYIRYNIRREILDKKYTIRNLAFRFYQKEAETGNKKYFESPEVGNRCGIKKFCWNIWDWHQASLVNKMLLKDWSMGPERENRKLQPYHLLLHSDGWVGHPI